MCRREHAPYFDGERVATGAFGAFSYEQGGARQRLVRQERVQNDAVEDGAGKGKALRSESTEENRYVLFEPVPQIDVGQLAERPGIVADPLAFPQTFHQTDEVSELGVGDIADSEHRRANADSASHAEREAAAGEA